MACKTSTTKINGRQFTYTQLTAKKSMKLKFRIAALLGSAVVDIVPAIKKKEEDQMAAFGEALQKVFSRNDPDVIMDLIEDIFIPAFCEDHRIDIDEDFTGNMEELYEVLFWVLKEEYGNFLKGLGKHSKGKQSGKKNSEK